MELSHFQMVHKELSLVFVPVTPCCDMENAILILVLHGENILPFHKLSKRDFVFFLQTHKDLLRSLTALSQKTVQENNSCQAKDCEQYTEHEVKVNHRLIGWK